jgi:DNA polymerase III epsilon subunit-like protein
MELLILDIETDDLEPSKGAIVEIGAVILNTEDFSIKIVLDKLILEEKHELIENAYIFGHSTLTPSLIREKGVSLDSIRDELQTLFNKYPTIAYSSAFDFGFLKARGFDIKRPGPDPKFLLTGILKIPKKGGGYKWPTVQECLNYFKINGLEPHRACEDASYEAKIVAEMIKRKLYDLNSSVFQAIQSENKDEGNLIRYKAKVVLYQKISDLFVSLLGGYGEDMNPDKRAIAQKAINESKDHLLKDINEKRIFCEKEIIRLEKKPETGTNPISI